MHTFRKLPKTSPNVANEMAHKGSKMPLKTDRYLYALDYMAVRGGRLRYQSHCPSGRLAGRLLKAEQSRESGGRLQRLRAGLQSHALWAGGSIGPRNYSAFLA